MVPTMATAPIIPIKGIRVVIDKIMSIDDALDIPATDVVTVARKFVPNCSVAMSIPKVGGNTATPIMK